MKPTSPYYDLRLSFVFLCEFVEFDFGYFEAYNLRLLRQKQHEFLIFRTQAVRFDAHGLKVRIRELRSQNLTHYGTNP